MYGHLYIYMTADRAVYMTVFEEKNSSAFEDAVCNVYPVFSRLRLLPLWLPQAEKLSSRWVRTIKMIL